MGFLPFWFSKELKKKTEGGPEKNQGKLLALPSRGY